MPRNPPTSRPYVIGLTGSIAMGKSETAKLFAAEGVAVHDADAAIHRLYGKGGAAAAKIAEIYPQVIRDGAVDRAALSALVTGDSVALARLEALVHPLVVLDRDAFLKLAPRPGWTHWWWPALRQRCSASAPWSGPA